MNAIPSQARPLLATMLVIMGLMICEAVLVAALSKSKVMDAVTLGL